MSGTHPEAVQLVAVRFSDTSHLARRARARGHVVGTMGPFPASNYGYTPGVDTDMAVMP